MCEKQTWSACVAVVACMEEELDISEMGDMLSKSLRGAEKLGPPVATSSALDLLESTLKGLFSHSNPFSYVI